MTSRDKKQEQGFHLTLRNAKKQFEAAEILADKSNYGLATAILVLSAEEAIKAYSMLGNYLFPEFRTADDDKVFADHKYKLNTIRGMLVLSRISQAMFDLFYLPIIENNDKTSAEAVRKQGVQNLIVWLKNETKSKRSDHNLQLDWWRHAQSLKEDGFYVRHAGESWHSPENIKKLNYVKTKKYVADFLQNIDSIGQIDFESEMFRSCAEGFQSIMNSYNQK